MELPILNTERLTLRSLTAQDADAIFAIFGDPRVMRYWSSPAQKDVAESAHWIENNLRACADGSLLLLGIERRIDQQLIGTCTLHARHVASRRGELGYSLGADYWGQGYMQEALKRFLAYIFLELDLNRLEADIDPANLASARTLERLGFERQGYLPERWIVSGTVSDSAIYGLVARRWRALSHSSESSASKL